MTWLLYINVTNHFRKLKDKKSIKTYNELNTNWLIAATEI